MATLLAAASCSSGSGGHPGQGTDAGAERVVAEAPDDASRLGADTGADGPVPDERREPDAVVSDARASDAVVADLATDARASDGVFADLPLDRSPSDPGFDTGSADGVPDRFSTDVPTDTLDSDASSCPGTTIRCSTTCIDPTSDPKHCGATLGCGTNGGSTGAVCASNLVCSTLVFQKQSFATGTTPKAVAVADFDGDGRADLAVANSGASSVSVLLGNGDGTFRTATSFVAHDGPQSIAIADLNRDGKLDIVVGNNLSNDVSVLLGNGDGTFDSHHDIAVGTGPDHVAVADFDGDGNLDVAVGCGGSQDVRVLQGHGDGTLSAGVQIASSEPYPQIPAMCVASADLDGNGKVDLVMGNSRTLQLAFGNGDGTFKIPTDVTFSTGAAIAFADLDRDGKLDIVAQALQGAMVLFGKDHWTIKSTVQEIYLSDVNSLVVADLDGDGILDIAATAMYSFVVALGVGDGTFKPKQDFPGGNITASMVVHDFNGDGRPDLAFTDSSANAVRVMLSGSAAASCR